MVSAAQRVFALPELVEQILLRLLDCNSPGEFISNMRTVLLARTASSTWHHLIEASPALRGQLYLSPSLPSSCELDSARSAPPAAASSPSSPKRQKRNERKILRPRDRGAATEEGPGGDRADDLPFRFNPWIQLLLPIDWSAPEVRDRGQQHRCAAFWKQSEQGGYRISYRLYPGFTSPWEPPRDEADEWVKEGLLHPGEAPLTLHIGNSARAPALTEMANSRLLSGGPGGRGEVAEGWRAMLLARPHFTGLCCTMSHTRLVRVTFERASGITLGDLLECVKRMLEIRDEEEKPSAAVQVGGP